MTSITATGNNFGAGDIRFQAFIEENYLILNSEVSFDPSNAQYQAVSQLEIYVPDLPIGKSAITGMLMFGTLNGEKNGTAIKACIQDKNTIAVEKVTAWDDNETITLVFSNSFVPRNVKGSIGVLKWNYISLLDKVGNISTYQSYWTFTDDWVFMAITFSSSSRLTQRQKFRSESRICPRLKTLTELLWMTRRFHRQSAQRCSALRFGTMCSPLKSSIRDTPGIHPSTADSSATFQEK